MAQRSKSEKLAASDQPFRAQVQKTVFLRNRYAAAKLGVNMKFNTARQLGVPKLFLSLAAN
jgi:hypothetical protein